MNIQLHIERLVLDGLSLRRTEGHSVKTAMEAELARLLSEHGLNHELHQGGAVPEVRAGGFQPNRNASPRQLGRQIARSVYGGIGKAK